jgi:hypothetical protein
MASTSTSFENMFDAGEVGRGGWELDTWGRWITTRLIMRDAGTEAKPESTKANTLLGIGC